MKGLTIHIKMISRLTKNIIYSVRDTKTRKFHDNIIKGNPNQITNNEFIKQSIINKILEVTEEYYQTSTDHNQLPINYSSYLHIQTLHPNTLQCCIVDEKPIAWIISIPTSINLMSKFLDNEINENELLKLTKPGKIYEAVYLCVAYTMPDYRRGGLIKDLISKSINGLPLIRNYSLYSWPYSVEGEKTTYGLEKHLDYKILQKKK